MKKSSSGTTTPLRLSMTRSHDDVDVDPKLLNVDPNCNDDGVELSEIGPRSFAEFADYFGLKRNCLPNGFETYGIDRDTHGNLLTEQEVEDRREKAEVGEPDGKNT